MIRKEFADLVILCKNRFHTQAANKRAQKMFNRFEICEAYYLFLSSNHEGQFSKKYARMCKLLTYFRPSPLLTYDRASEDLQLAVQELEAREA